MLLSQLIATPPRAIALVTTVTMLSATVAWATTRGPAPAATPAPAVARHAPATAPVAIPAPVTPAPAPASTAQSAPERVAPAILASRPAPAAAVATPVSHTNFLASDDGSLRTGVGNYPDCTGETPLGRDGAAIETCVQGRLYFVGHAFGGPFTPLNHMDVGAGLTYWDGNSVAHHYRVVSVRPSWTRTNGIPPVTRSDVAAQFQCSAVPDGSIDRILDAVADPAVASAPARPPAAAPAPTPAPATTTTAGYGFFGAPGFGSAYSSWQQYVGHG